MSGRTGSCPLGEALYSIPILWLNFFRLADLRDNWQLSTTVEKALRQFDTSLPVVESMFSSYPVEQLAGELTALVSTFQRQDLVLDYDEIENLDPEPIQAKIRYALLALDGQIPTAVGRTSLLGLSGVDITMPLPDHAFIGDLTAFIR